jgi:hypothetical protein
MNAREKLIFEIRRNGLRRMSHTGKGMSDTEYAMLNFLEETIKKDTPAIKPDEPPKPPKPKGRGGKINLWLDWYHAMLDNGYKCTLDDVASKSGYSLGYIKQRHMIYQAKPNQNI